MVVPDSDSPKTALILAVGDPAEYLLDQSRIIVEQIATRGETAGTFSGLIRAFIPFMRRRVAGVRHRSHGFRSDLRRWNFARGPGSDSGVGDHPGRGQRRESGRIAIAL